VKLQQQQRLHSVWIRSCLTPFTHSKKTERKKLCKWGQCQSCRCHCRSQIVWLLGNLLDKDLWEKVAV